MANAKKCDICGKLYEIYNTDHDQSKPNGLTFINVDLDNEYYLRDDDEYLECCPECMDSIQEHIKSLRGEVKKPVYDKVCFNCKYFKEEPDSNYCIDCPTPENAHSKWVAKE